MPELIWTGKDKVIAHHLDVPLRLLDKQYAFGDNTDATHNRIIHGDNLEALKALLPEFQGRVKCIYIDPPYNTGNEGWVYNDNVNDPKIRRWLNAVVGKEGEDLSRHDKWLCMMYPRLKLLHQLLAEDGVIFISIDDNEQANLKLICDEIFGGNNFVTNIIWEKNYSPRNDAKYFSASHDFIVLYAKSKINWTRNLAPRTDKQNKFYKYNDNDGRGLWRPDNVLVKSFSETGVFGIENPNNGEVHFPPKGSCYRFNEEKSRQMLSENRFYFGKDRNGKPQLKRYLLEVNDGVVPQTIWKYDEVSHNQEGKKELNKIIDGNVFDSPKPHQLIEKILQIATNPTDLILDSFAGSGTTAHAVLNLNKADGGKRRFILVEMEPYAESITAERVRRVIDGYGTTDGTGGGFGYYTLGEKLWDTEGSYLNDGVPLLALRRYIAFAEGLDSVTDVANDPYFIGQNNGAAYYLCYGSASDGDGNSDGGASSHPVAITYALLATLQNRQPTLIIYADSCQLTAGECQSLGIIFKQIPRDIAKY